MPEHTGGRRDRGDKVPDFVREELLAHPKRRELFETLQERPGMNKHQLATELGIYPNLLQYHLEQLEDAAIVVTARAAQGKEVLCFTHEDAGLWEDERTRILFGRRPVRNVALYLAENPGTSTHDMAEALSCTTATIRHHLRTLSDFGLIERHRAGRRHLYEAEEELHRWARTIGEAFSRPWLEGDDERSAAKRDP